MNIKACNMLQHAFSITVNCDSKQNKIAFQTDRSKTPDSRGHQKVIKIIHTAFHSHEWGLPVYSSILLARFTQFTKYFKFIEQVKVLNIYSTL